ncbi:MAG TPA: aminotransferase class I/II-fold pyridoxal phosphate-dependent enzyme [Candidatus Dormibacteraeota bacterium]|nr:aminotransferase class I/II-fold pyridoxal phosphate-dependent enzyme [Candidatus Dormibacteraeota bacterium]
MIDPIYRISGRGAAEIAASVESGIRAGALPPGTRLPPIRGLARELGVSPATVTAAYRLLRGRGWLTGAGRQGTAVQARPALVGRRPAAVPPGVRDLASGNPDPRLLPALGPVLRALPSPSRLYGAPAVLPELAAHARRQLAADDIDPTHLTVTSGALDALERVLAAELRPGDRVAVEDPGYTALLDLLVAMGLRPEPVALDDEGPLPAAFATALARGCAACVITPRAQNPTGAALTPARAQALRALLDQHPAVLVVEDDHAGAIAGTAAASLCAGRPPRRWAVARSVAKSLGPDLRLAVVAGDAETVGRVADRILLGPEWVSHLLQRAVVRLWEDPATAVTLARAATTYRARRTGLLTALARRDIPARGRSGFNVWVPVREETATVQSLLARGWALRAGETFRLASPPAVRISTATLRPAEAERLARDLAAVLAGTGRTPEA